MRVTGITLDFAGQARRLRIDIREGTGYFLLKPVLGGVNSQGGHAMPDANDGLTLEGLARILRDHMDGTAARFAEVGARIDDLRREVVGVAGMVRDLSQVVLRQVDEVAEHRRELEEHRRLHEEHRQDVRQIFSRMEQRDARLEETNREFRARMAEHDARFEAMSRDIRQILDALERRGGDGGRRP